MSRSGSSRSSRGERGGTPALLQMEARKRRRPAVSPRANQPRADQHGPRTAAGDARRLRQEGVSASAADRGVTAIAEALASGPMTRDQLGARVAARGVRTAGQALIHILMLASLRGVAVRGPMHGKQHAYALTQ